MHTPNVNPTTGVIGISETADFLNHLSSYLQDFGRVCDAQSLVFCNLVKCLVDFMLFFHSSHFLWILLVFFFKCCLFCYVIAFLQYCLGLISPYCLFCYVIAYFAMFSGIVYAMLIVFAMLSVFVRLSCFFIGLVGVFCFFFKHLYEEQL